MLQTESGGHPPHPEGSLSGNDLETEPYTNLGVCCRNRGRVHPETPTLLGFVERANFNHGSRCLTPLYLRTEATHFQNAVFFKIPDD
jgi:hypothetical protein